MSWDKLIDRRIRTAMEAGEFDNLPGKGEPLTLDDDPLLDPEWRLAHHVLRNAGEVPVWVGLMRETREELNSAREEFATASKRWDETMPERLRAQEQFEFQLEKINNKIEALNRLVPVSAYQWSKIEPVLEVERILSRQTTED
jgi:DnaJ family protein C protein 28